MSMSPRRAWGITLAIVGAIGLAIMLSVTAPPPSSRAPSLQFTDPPAPSCGSSDIAVDKLRVRVEYGYAHVTGLVTNHCARGTGVQLKFTAYGRDGDVVTSSDFWPDSISNIPVNTVFPFEWVQPVGDFQKYTVEVIDVKRW